MKWVFKSSDSDITIPGEPIFLIQLVDFISWLGLMKAILILN